MKSVVLITGHYWNSDRRAGFHWLADAYLRAGYRVLFFTTCFSWISVLRRDYRLSYPGFWKLRNRIEVCSSNIFSFAWYTPFHPADLRSQFLNKITSPIFAIYGRLLILPDVIRFFEEADLFIFESNPGLLLFDRIKKINPRARYVYRVSDDLRILKNHPVTIKTEDEILSKFDLVSLPSAYMLANVCKKNPNLDNIKLHLHAIKKDLFDCDYQSPYVGRVGTNVVFVGNSHFDQNFLELASRIFDSWNFHIIGLIDPLPKHPNVFWYGEMPFNQTIPYIKYADIGLANRTYMDGAESLSDSLKIIQYSYCKLPVIVPDFLRSDRSNLFKYTPNDAESIRQALMAAKEFDRNSMLIDNIYSWSDLSEQLSGGEKTDDCC